MTKIAEKLDKAKPAWMRKFDSLAATSIRTCLVKFVDGNGRSARAEFWIFMLWVQLVYVVLGFILGNFVERDTAEVIIGIAVCVFLFPQLSVGARRLHDTGRSGWWQLLYLTIIGIIPLIIWFATKGSDKANEYGELTRVTESL